MKKINALIVDDEIAALNTLRGMLGDYCPQIRIVGSARSVEEAVQAVVQRQPAVRRPRGRRRHADPGGRQGIRMAQQGQAGRRHGGNRGRPAAARRAV